jgi:hypothetical protein
VKRLELIEPLAAAERERLAQRCLVERLRAERRRQQKREHPHVDMIAGAAGNSAAPGRGGAKSARKRLA